MLKRLPVLIGLPQPQRSDWLLSSMGVSAATVSAAFAGYMMLIGPHGGSHRATPAAVADGLPIVIAEAAPTHPTLVRLAPSAGSAPTLAGDVDFTPTGSIAPRTGLTASLPGEDGSPADLAGPRRRIASVIIRDVFDGKALVEENNRLRLIQPGSVLDTAGKVLAIRREGSGWVVETEGGVIQ